MPRVFTKLGLMKRKWMLTCFCTVFGAIIAILTGADLNTWMLFAIAMIGTFGGIDVADKKLNGGTYNESDHPAP